MTFYIVRESYGYKGLNVYIATTKEECEKHIMEFCDMYDTNGACTINETDEFFHIIKSYYYEAGKLTGTKDWNKTIMVE